MGCTKKLQEKRDLLTFLMKLDEVEPRSGCHRRIDAGVPLRSDLNFSRHADFSPTT